MLHPSNILEGGMNLRAESGEMVESIFERNSELEVFGNRIYKLLINILAEHYIDSL